MGTNRSFNDMLNENLNYKLLRNTYEERDYVMSVVEKDDGWTGGNLVVPFEGAYASSAEFGQLTDSSDVAEYDYVRGGISTQPELWGTLQFHQRDLWEHEQVNEKNLLKMLPNQVDQFMKFLKMTASIYLLSGRFATIKVDGESTGGTIGVDRIDRFSIGQKISLKGDTAALASFYVTAIDVNKKQLTLATARGGAVHTNVNLYTVADNAFVSVPGAVTNGSFSSVKAALLPANSTGISGAGSTTLYGVTKTSFPYLQAWSRSGNATLDDGNGRVGLQIDSTNILDKLFDFYIEMRQFTVGNPTEIWLSYKHFASILKILESQKGGYRTSENSRKTVQFGWDEVVIMGLKGNMKVVAIQEMDDDYILFMDLKALKFHSNGMFKKAMAPDGNAYTWTRTTAGIKYFCDIALFGDLVVYAPQKCGIIYNISY